MQAYRGLRRGSRRRASCIGDGSWNRSDISVLTCRRTRSRSRSPKRAAERRARGWQDREHAGGSENSGCELRTTVDVGSGRSPTFDRSRRVSALGPRAGMKLRHYRLEANSVQRAGDVVPLDLPKGSNPMPGLVTLPNAARALSLPTRPGGPLTREGAEFLALAVRPAVQAGRGWAPQRIEKIQFAPELPRPWKG